MSTRVRPYSHPPPTCPICHKLVESQQRSSCCRACGSWMHRDCSIDRWCADCLLSEPHTRSKALVLSKHFEDEMGNDHIPALVFAASFMVGAKREAVRELLDNWPPGIETVMDNYEKNGVWTPDGMLAIDETSENDDGSEASIAFCLAMMCGSGELVRFDKTRIRVADTVVAAADQSAEQSPLDEEEDGGPKPKAKKEPGT